MKVRTEPRSVNLLLRSYLWISSFLALVGSISGIWGIFSNDLVNKISIYPQYRKVSHYSLWDYSRMTHSTATFVKATILLLCLILLGIHSALIFKKIWSNGGLRCLYRVSAINVSVLLFMRIVQPLTSAANFHQVQKGIFEAWQLGAGHIGLSWACVLATASILTFKLALRHTARFDTKNQSRPTG